MNWKVGDWCKIDSPHCDFLISKVVTIGKREGRLEDGTRFSLLSGKVINGSPASNGGCVIKLTAEDWAYHCLNVDRAKACLIDWSTATREQLDASFKLFGFGKCASTEIEKWLKKQ